MALIYLMSELSKLRDSGLDWVRGDNIEQRLVEDALSPIFLDYKWKATVWLVQHHAPGLVFTVIVTFGLVVELGYVGVLFSRNAHIIMPMTVLTVLGCVLILQHI